MPMTDQVWIVDDDSSIRWVLERALNQASIPNDSFADGDQLLQRLQFGAQRAMPALPLLRRWPGTARFARKGRAASSLSVCGNWSQPPAHRAPTLV